MMDKQQPPLCVVSGDRLKEKRKTNYNFNCTDFLTNVKLRKKPHCWGQRGLRENRRFLVHLKH